MILGVAGPECASEHDFRIDMSTLSSHEMPSDRPDGSSGYHRAVMVSEVLEIFSPIAGRLIVDGTLGGGGHTKALLDAGAKIIGLDHDGGAIGYCIQHLVVYDADSVRLVRANFRDLNAVLDRLNIDKVDGILLDLGVSSAQLDQAERGFSFQRSGPLDMRMDLSIGRNAADIVNNDDQEKLTQIFRSYGEESAARRVAAAIIRERASHPFTDTLSLAKVVEDVIPKRGPRHPATKVFQALRIAVNDELGALYDGLIAATNRLRRGGRLAVITFHSLEDRVVKNFVRETTIPFLDRPEWPAPRPNPRYAFRSLTKRAIQPSAAEQNVNPRSRSAKLRALEKISSPLEAKPG